MFIELADSLRCVRPHEDSWLVLAAERMVGRYVIEGTLGCPVCRAEYPIRDAVLHMEGEGSPTGPTPSRVSPPDADAVLRAAALLGLTDQGGYLLLCGEWAPYARALVEVAPAQVILLDPLPAVIPGDGVSVILAPVGALPFAAGSLHGIALDPAAASAGLAAAAARALRPRGRLVAPVTTPLPANVSELARDEREWVAESGGGVSAPVQLGIGRARP